MATFQLPPLKNSEQFEHFVCDLFNHIDQTDSYTEFQIFGVKGQNQKVIDIFSQRTKTVIQCKVKDNRGKPETVRKKLIAEMEEDLIKVEALSFPFERIIFASTFRDDAVIQEHLSDLRSEREYPFSISYFGWDTLTNYVENYELLLRKYFRQFRQKTTKPELPEGALGKDLLKKNYIHYLIKRYAEWKQFELDRHGKKFYYASFNKHLMNKFKATGINHIPLLQFDDVAAYLQTRIDGTIFGKNQKAKAKRNYSTFQEYLNEISN